MYSASEIKDGRVSLTKWQKIIFADFDATVCNKDRPFPCIFGVNGYKKDMLRFSFYEELTAEALRDDLIEFCENYKSYGKQTSFVVFERPSPITSIEEYSKKFWRILEGLSKLDNTPWPADIPEKLDDPAWEFCFHGVPMFIVCNTPAHVNRLSRRSPGFMLTIQPRWVFDDLLDTDSKANSAFATVTKRLEPYDAVPKSPFLGKYGDINNREWLQYFLDDGDDKKIACPFHKMQRNNSQTCFQSDTTGVKQDEY
ncbi:YqcI/YcgG family protein [Pantoea sp. FN0302]|uniref:YqcI/YcgG family protein n=1 Tax=Pantoea sp. FN0302 TaxID=3418558 RepID=UPI003CE6F9A4